PEVCTWLCPVEQQCQGSCLQGFIGDGALPIAGIQRYLAEQANKNGWSRLNIPEKSTGKKIDVIGAGPAGIAATAKLLEFGHIVTIFDKNEDFGGMITSVIPLDRGKMTLQKELAAIFSDVPECRLIFKRGTQLNEQLNLDNVIAKGFDAVFIGIGLSEAIRVSGEKVAGVEDALTFLQKAKSQELDFTGKRVAVIGGGNAAMDAAVTAKRCGACDVYLIYRRSFEQMPAWKNECDRALGEGVHFQILTQQLGYTTKDNKLTGIKLCPTKLGTPDESGRRKPLPVENSCYELEFDLVIEAIGQRASANLKKVLPGIEIRSGLIMTKKDSYMTSRRGVFAGGDIIRGPSTVVRAVADGMQGAIEIHEYLKDKPPDER
ncbi:MAG: FAD-dependent oxidoreductase, partial [Planctomycetota bacterium]